MDIVSVFAKHLGFDESYGNRFEVNNGRYTGHVYGGDVVKDKSKVLNAFLEKHKGKFDLYQSIGVGDTDSDIAILDMVSCPIAFNPNRKLAEYAKNNKWMIVVERKDVVYKLQEYKFLDSVNTEDVFSHYSVSD